MLSHIRECYVLSPKSLKFIERISWILISTKIYNAISTISCIYAIRDWVSAKRLEGWIYEYKTIHTSYVTTIWQKDISFYDVKSAIQICEKLLHDQDMVEILWW